MPANTAFDVGTAFLRWTHVVAVVVWLGQVYFLAWIRGHFEAALADEQRSDVRLALLPRVLAWARWGAAVTWMSGFVLLFLVYYRTALLLDGARLGPDLLAQLTDPSGRPTPRAWLPGFFSLLAGFALYDTLFRWLRGAAAELVAAVVWGALLIGMGCVLEQYGHFSTRAVYVHLGAIMGTAMAANMWMRIWPAQERSIAALRANREPDARDLALASSRLRHNLPMSLATLLLMLSNHHPTFYGGGSWPWQAWAATVLGIGLVSTFVLERLARIGRAR